MKRREGWKWHEQWAAAPSRANMTQKELDESRAYLHALALRCEEGWRRAAARREARAAVYADVKSRAAGE
jgi:hypothetical protein